MRTKLPRARKNLPISATDWNIVVEAVERADSLSVDGSSGLELVESRVGRRLRFIGINDAPVRYIKLSVALPAGDGVTATGHGKGKLMDHKDGATDGDAGSLSVPSGAADVDVYGLLTPGLKSGSTIAAFRLGNSWHYLMTICTNVNG